MGFDWEFMLGDDGDLADLYDEHIVEDYDDYRVKNADSWRDPCEYEDESVFGETEDDKNQSIFDTGEENNTTNYKGERNMCNTIKISELKNDSGAFILVKGKVTYSHIGNLIQGEELQIMNQKSLQCGRVQYHHAYTTMTITEAVVQVADPQNPSLPEQWAMSKLYKSHGAHATRDSMNFCGTCMSNYLPSVYKTAVRDGKTLLVGEYAYGREIAIGTEVTLVLKVYESKGKVDVGLRYVVVAAAEIPWREYKLQHLADLLHVDGIIPATSEKVTRDTEERDNSKPGSKNFEPVFDDCELPF